MKSSKTLALKHAGYAVSLAQYWRGRSMLNAHLGTLAGGVGRKSEGHACRSDHRHEGDHGELSG
jgi:hypothetical protein